MKLYFVIPETMDGCELPTQPEPIPLEQVGKHLSEWLARYQVQGYYSNARMERIGLDEITFSVVPEGREA